MNLPLNSLRHLPREARDTIFLLVVTGWIVLPLTPHIPEWSWLLAGGLLIWRSSLAWHGSPLPSRWWLIGLLLVATAATFFTHKTLMGRNAGVTFLVVLLAMKTLEMRGRRDAFVIFFLGFFVLLSNFFFSQSLLVAMAMLIGLLGLLTALVNSHMPVGRPPLWYAAKTAGWMALLGAPIMLVLFLLFPRIAPLWGVPSDAMAGRTGLSSRMEVGSVAKLAQDDSIAMRVRFEGTSPPESQMYFRGPVLSRFDGRVWEPYRGLFMRVPDLKADLQVQGKPIVYQVTLETTHRPWLLPLDAALTKPTAEGLDARMSPELQWEADKPISDMLRYKATSYTNFRHGPMQSTTALQNYVAMPLDSNPRTLAFANALRQDPRYQGKGKWALVEGVLTHLQTGGYTYTLEPGEYGIHSADEFWFDKKVGFCEHIASSFVILMRYLNIPARIVTGYQGGQMNPVDGFWTVRQSDAHAWSEVWIAERGWVRVDPTSAVAPARTGSAVRLTVPAGAIAAVFQGAAPQFALELRMMWEAANNSWNQWVLNYTQSKQFDMLRKLGFESPDWEDLSYLFIGIIVGMSGLAMLWAAWERHQQNPWLRLLNDAAVRLRKAGFEIPANASPRQMAALVNIPEIAQWLLRMETWRYAPAATNAAASSEARATFKRLQKEFRHVFHHVPASPSQAS